MRMAVKAAMAMAVLAVAAACGGGSAGPTTPATPAPTPTPAPQPTPSPSATPCPDGACGNTNAVVRVRFRIYLVFDKDGDVVEPTPDPVGGVLREPLPVGYRIRYDVIGEDSRGRETNGQKNIQWIVTQGAHLVEDLGYREENFQKDVRGIAAGGPYSQYVVFDGVASNSIVVSFVN
jgi:hypothetical protein